MSNAMSKLKAHPAVACVDIDSDGVMVGLAPGWTNDPLGGCPTSFGEDSPRLALKYLKEGVVKCTCRNCGGK